MLTLRNRQGIPVWSPSRWRYQRQAPLIEVIMPWFPGSMYSEDTLDEGLPTVVSCDENSCAHRLWGIVPTWSQLELRQR